MYTARIVFVASIVFAASTAHAQVGRPAAQKPKAAKGAAETVATQPPPGYVIGPDDVLRVVFWRDADMSSEVVVRPDGMITLPLVNDIPAAGLTPAELGSRVTSASARFIETPNVSVIVKEINSRKVFVTGQVVKPGDYPLANSMTVVQALAMAGGLKDYADAKNILVMRKDQSRTNTFKFNYKDFSNRKHLEQDLELKPGDTIVVP
jgi:polysaccharide export outer membrane protein